MSEQPKIQQIYEKKPEPLKIEQVHKYLNGDGKIGSFEAKVAMAKAEKARKVEKSKNSVVFTHPIKGKEFMADNRIMVGFPDSADSPNKPEDSQNPRKIESNPTSELAKKYGALTIENNRLRVNGTPSSIETTGARVPMQYASIEKVVGSYYIKASAYNELSFQLELILKSPSSQKAKYFISHFDGDYGVNLSEAYWEDKNENKDDFKKFVKQQLGLVQSLMDSQKTKEIKGQNLFAVAQTGQEFTSKPVMPE